jgi:hypothetical protein
MCSAAPRGYRHNSGLELPTRSEVWEVVLAVVAGEVSVAERTLGTRRDSLEGMSSAEEMSLLPV